MIYYNFSGDNLHFTDFYPILINNEIYYQYSYIYHTNGKPNNGIILLDGNYEKVLNFKDKLFQVDTHESIILGINHIIYSTYHPDYINNKLAYIIKILEYKNGKTTELFNSLDYPEFVEMSTEKNNIKPTNTPIDYLHLNSMQLVGDGSILISMPAANAIIKYNYKDKKIEWILGGKLDQFGLSKEQHFYFQHFARLNGDELTLFDNGIKNRWDIKDDGYARAIEFKIDEKNKKIISFKEYKNELHKNVNFCGSFQKNVVDNDIFYNIGWGCFTPKTDKSSAYYTEVDMTNNKINFELYFYKDLNGSYRILKYPY